MSHVDPEDPRCPNCGGPIGATATYCMHCSTDLTEARARADADRDGHWDGAASDGTASDRRASDRRASDGTAVEPGSTERHWLHPDGVVDDTLTAIVGLVGGFVVGLVGTMVLLILTSSGWAFLPGMVAWLAATAHLVTRRSVHEAVSRTAYGVAIVLLLVPFVAFGPSESPTDLVERVVVFAFMLGGLAVPAAVAAGIGYGVSRIAPDTDETVEDS